MCYLRHERGAKTDREGTGKGQEREENEQEHNGHLGSKRRELQKWSWLVTAANLQFGQG